MKSVFLSLAVISLVACGNVKNAGNSTEASLSSANQLNGKANQLLKKCDSSLSLATFKLSDAQQKETVYSILRRTTKSESLEGIAIAVNDLESCLYGSELQFLFETGSIDKTSKNGFSNSRLDISILSHRIDNLRIRSGNNEIPVAGKLEKVIAFNTCQSANSDKYIPSKLALDAKWRSAELTHEEYSVLSDKLAEIEAAADAKCSSAYSQVN